MRPRRTSLPGAALALLALLPACATNPATGRRQLSLIGEEQEIQMGRQADQEIAAAVGVYQDADLQAYVERIGRALAARSERPNLPWTFRILDDASVNAMALPGGFVYVTRGLLTYLNSEAELASVLGHEIGHITARHTVNRLSTQQVAQLGVVLGMILRPELRNYGSLADVGLGLLFLKYSRDDEREADDLGLRYAGRGGYDLRPAADVFTTLERVSAAEGQGRVPGWLATHPAPEDRRQRIAAAIQAMPGGAGGTVDRPEYLRRIDGVVFGPDPREGFFQQNAFYHPELRFRFEFPQGWQTSNQKQAVSAMSPGNDALVVITLSGRDSPEAAAREFFSQQGIQQGQAWRGSIGGLPATAHSFAALTRQGQLQGTAAFVALGGRVYQILGYTPSGRWGRYQDTINRAIGSFATVTDPRILRAEPRRVRVVDVPAGLTPSELSRRYPSTVPPQTLANLNGVAPGQALPAGMAKTVVGGAPV